jgi:hypothetical protein
MMRARVDLHALLFFVFGQRIAIIIRRFSGTENRTVGSDYEDRQVFGQSDTRFWVQEKEGSIRAFF